MSQLTLDEFSCAPCTACGHARAFHRPNDGPCLGELNGNSLSRSDIDLENFQERKEMRAECWCWRYETDAAAGIDSILKDGNDAALVAATNAAIERDEHLDAQRLVNRYIRITVQGGRDTHWIQTIERVIAQSQSQATPAGNVGTPESQSISVKDAGSPGIKDAIGEKKRNDAQPVLPFSTAPAPITPLRGSRITHAPKPAQIPLDWPLNYPNNLKPQSVVIIGSAVKKFPLQSQTVELCRYIISTLTPHFCAAVRRKALPADLVLSRMSDLLRCLLVYNCDGSSQMFRLEQEVMKSEEWMKLAGKMARKLAVANCGNTTDPRAVIDAFISKLAESGRKITRKDIWTAAGYEDATEFERFQRGDARTTNSATTALKRVLNMEPDDFVRLLEKKSVRK